MEKVCLFARVSTTLQDLSSQEQALLDAAHRDGIKDEDIIIISEQESAVKNSIEERIGLTKAKQAVLYEGVKTIYCYELSRIARRLDVFYEFRKFLVDNQVQLKVLNPQVNLLNDSGEIDENFSLVFSIFASLAEQETRLLKARLKRGKIKHANENKFVGGRCLLGYYYDTDKRFKINEKESAIVRRIFTEYIDEDKTMVDIARDLVLDGTYTNTVNSARMMVERTLNNESYYGKPIQEQNVYYKAVYPRFYPAIISKDRFDEAIAKRNRNKKSQKKKSYHKYLCRGIVFYPDGKPFWANYSSKAFCCTLEHTAESKKTLSISIDALDALVWDYVRIRVLNAPKNDPEREKIELQSKIQTAANAIKTLEEKIKESTEQIERLEIRIIKGKLTEISAEKIEKEIEKERSSFKQMIVQKKEEIESLARRIKELDSGIMVYTEEELESADFNRKRDLILQNVDRIVVTKLSKHHRLVTIFHNIADDGVSFDLNTYTKQWEKWEIRYS